MTTHRRFDRAARLLGDAGIARLATSTVTVFGVGGVGSFAAEALVRSGVGRVILVDYDRICVTNVNRQLHAMKGTLGKSKVEVMAERLRLINPDATIEARAEFYSAETSARLLVPEPDVVIDAIDNMAAKMHLIATCVREQAAHRVGDGRGGAARSDAVRVADLSETKVDPFARDLRRNLRTQARPRLHAADRRVGGVLRGAADRAARARVRRRRVPLRVPGRRERRQRLRAQATASRARSRSCRRCSA